MGLVGLGVPLLDELLPRGIPTGSHVLLRGPLGGGKTYIAMSLVRSWITRGMPVVYTCIDDDPEDIVEALRSMVDSGAVDSALGGGGLAFIDLFTPRVDSLYQVRRRGLGVVRPKGDDARSLMEALGDVASRLSNPLIIIDSLNDPILRMEPRAVLDLVKGIRLVSRAHDALAFSIVHTGNDDVDAVVNAVEFSVNGILEVDTDPTLQQAGLTVRRLRVRRMRGVPHSLDYVHFDITEKGLVLIDVDNLIKGLNEALRKMGIRTD